MKRFSEKFDVCACGYSRGSESLTEQSFADSGCNEPENDRNDGVPEPFTTALALGRDLNDW